MLTVSAEKPSKYIPFKGDFPLLSPALEKEYFKEVTTHTYLDEVEPWVQNIIGHAERIVTIEEGFKDYLEDNHVLNSYNQMTNADKADWLVRFLNANCLTLECLKVK